jgi:hypothetical protein
MLGLMAALLVGGCGGTAATDQRVAPGRAPASHIGPATAWASDCPGCGVNLGGGPGMLGGGIYETVMPSHGRP